MEDGFDREVSLQARRRADVLQAMGYSAAAGELIAMADVLDQSSSHARAVNGNTWSAAETAETADVESAA